LFKSLKSAF